MKASHSVPNQQPAPTARDRAEAEQAARMLDRLAEMAMEQAEVTHQAALAAARAGDAAQAKDLGLAFDRAARVVRRSLALKFRFARDRQEMADKAVARSRDQAEEKAGRRRQVARAVARSIAADRDIDGRKAERLSAEMWERLIDDEDIDAVLALAGHSVEEIVIGLCRDLGVDPKPVLLHGLDGADAGPAPPTRAGPPPDPPLPRPWWPYCRIIPTEEGRQVGEPYWWNCETDQRVEDPRELDELNARAAAARRR
ncbi:hypothetical protein [Inquilinus limosus]|uniref:Uncharacterized protein n=1 Tax=Inquilinus limosus TaxID=171674 RepID=A0A211ZR03_9PROT|nr:hypothetical protein [Inquilinus limosus]OWJ67693.1 hypothetical protein BWR60_08390 [Inquilinus limosus]